MAFLYHAIPENMTGSILYPLNILKEKYPDMYERHAAKYRDRVEVMAQPIPPLGCLWNDVLHLTAVPPAETKKALREAGSPDFQRSYYQIDPQLLEADKATVYLYAHRLKSEKFLSENFAVYRPDDIARYSSLPQETKDYYKEEFAAGRHPLTFHRVPHILYRGQLDVSGITIAQV